MKLLDFFSAFFKKSLNSLRTSMENETWTPCDVPYIFIHYIAFVCDFQTQNNEKDALGLEFVKSNRLSNYLNETNNFEEDQKSNDQNENISPFSLKKDISFTREAQEYKNKTGNNSIRIMKNELYIDENKFMLGTSTLNLIKSLYDFLIFMQISPVNSNETVIKIFELIKVINIINC